MLSPEWEQDYNNISSLPDMDFDEPAFDSTTRAAQMKAGGGATLSPKTSSCSGGGGGINPKGSIGKPVKKQSRAPKKPPPTTLLNADTKDFRALVQQLTGYHHKPPSFRSSRGPITLNFSQYKNYDYSRTVPDHAPQQQQQQQQQQLQQQQHQEDCWDLDEEYYSSNPIISELFSTESDDAAPPVVADAAATTSDLSSNLSTFDNPSPVDYPLTLDDFDDIVNFSLQEYLLGPDDQDCAAPVMTETSYDDIWGC